MTRRPHRLAWAALMLGTAALFAGCAERKQADGKVTITAMTFEWGTGEYDYRRRERIFDEQTTGIDLRILFVPYQNYVTKLMASFSGRMSADVIYSMTGRDRFFINAGVFQPLDDFINGPDGIDISDFNQTLLREQLTKDGKIYALPQAVNPLALFYNKRLFAEAGIEPLSETEPITWDRYREIATKLTKDENGDGQIDQYGCAPGFDGIQPTYFFYVVNETFAGHAYNEEGTEAYFDSEGTADALRYLHSLVHEYKCAPPPVVSQSLGVSLFLNNRLGMLINGPWTGYELDQTAPDLDYAVAPLPHRAGRPRANMIGGPAVGISSQSKQPAEAWQVVKFFVSPEFQKLPMQGLPSRASLLEEFDALRYWQVFEAELQHATANFFIAQYDGVTLLVQQTVEKILGDPKAGPRIPEMLRRMNDDVNAVLRTY
jgi:multiple sugar transport system substrate-binding protein